MTVSLVALFLVVASSLGWSAFDVLRKVLVQRVEPLPLLFALTLGQVPLFAVWTVLRPEAVGPGYWLPAGASVALNIVVNVAFLLAMKWSPLHRTIPLLSLIPALTTVLAIPLLGEVPGIRQWTGIVLVVFGALLLHLTSWKGLPELFSSLVREKGSLLMLLVVAGWSLTLPLDKLALRAAGVPFHGLVLTVGVSTGILGVMALRRETGQVRDLGRVPRLAALAVVVSTLALALQLLAMKMVFVSLVETLKRGIGNLMALVWGRFLLRETVRRHSVVAVVLMILGVSLILWPAHR